LPDPVLGGLHDVAQSLFVFTDLTFSQSPAGTLADFPERAAYRGRKPGRIRLQDVINCASTQRLDGTLLAYRSRKEDERRVRHFVRSDLERGESIEPRQREIGKDDVRPESR